MGIAISWFVFSVFAGAIAADKGRSGIGCFFLSLILTPVIGIIWALAAQPSAAYIDSKKIRSGEFKRCEYCKEVIKKDANVCRYCQKDVNQIEKNKGDSNV